MAPRYVHKPDPNYGYKLVNTSKGEGYIAYVLELTSQQWRTAEEVDRPICKHWLTIIQPDKVATPTGFLYINGGSNGSKMPAGPDAALAGMAVGTQPVVADLRRETRSTAVHLAGKGKLPRRSLQDDFRLV